MAAKKKSRDVKCKMVPTKVGGKKVRRCFKNGKFVKTPKK
jgi:ketol-acid reductoisomerase